MYIVRPGEVETRGALVRRESGAKRIVRAHARDVVGMS